MHQAQRVFQTQIITNNKRDILNGSNGKVQILTWHLEAVL